jgi:hypothetical protein
MNVEYTVVCESPRCQASGYSPILLIKLQFDYLDIITTGIDETEEIEITIKAAFEDKSKMEIVNESNHQQSDYIASNIGSIDITKNKNGENLLSYENINWSDKNVDGDDIVDLYLKVNIKCDEVSTKSDVNQVVLNIIEGDLPDSGIARWTFDDSDTVDSTSLDKWNNNDGTIVGNVTTSSQGIQNESYSFDSGNNNHISVPPINPREKITVSAWVKSGLNGQYNQNWSVVSNYQAFILGPRYNNENKMAFIVHTENTGWNYDSVASISNPEEWNHFIGTYDYETSKAKLYQNNTLVSTGTDPSGKISVENTDWEIGRREGRSGEDFNGKIDDVQIYGRVLTQEERDKLYNYYNV